PAAAAALAAAATTVAATPTVASGPLRRLWRWLIHDRQVGAGVALGHDLALVDPALDADPAERGTGFVEAVVDVRTQRMDGLAARTSRSRSRAGQCGC